MVGVVKEQLSLAEITRREVEAYVGFSDTATLYPVLDDKHQIYTVLVVPHWPRSFSAEIVVMARVVGDKIVIEEDTADKPLVDALMVNAGIPREQIVLAYRGEKIPD
jgi:hypothetical protein